MEQVSENMDGLRWFKSGHSKTSGGDCGEVAVGAGAVHVRDSRATGDGPLPRVGRND